MESLCNDIVLEIMGKMSKSDVIHLGATCSEMHLLAKEAIKRKIFAISVADLVAEKICYVQKFVEKKNTARSISIGRKRFGEPTMIKYKLFPSTTAVDKRIWISCYLDNPGVWECRRTIMVDTGLEPDDALFFGNIMNGTLQTFCTHKITMKIEILKNGTPTFQFDEKYTYWIPENELPEISPPKETLYSKINLMCRLIGAWRTEVLRVQKNGKTRRLRSHYGWVPETLPRACEIYNIIRPELKKFRNM